MSGTQWYYTALAVLIPFVLSLQVLLYRYLTRGRIDNRSLRYAIDNLPMGIAFYRGDGLLLLANDTIRSLCKRVTGSGLVNARVFHARLLELASGTDANAGTHADEFVLTLGQEVWSIRRKEVKSDGVSVYQLTAYETTELYEKSGSSPDSWRICVRRRNVSGITGTAWTRWPETKPGSPQRNASTTAWGRCCCRPAII